ncbi:expressed unknown protein [Seminavis robusta]|uniref:Uncharacterized protein n=1 Tax=Seminavis robusta TaxID=568900 RepID=A0A9N8DNH9_9STRA|nr:expressed unknown protein [Seminavis robusta]|eukprot:Sro180_g078910.1 n/a (80) ;mRNA; f:96747-96986
MDQYGSNHKVDDTKEPRANLQKSTHHHSMDDSNGSATASSMDAEGGDMAIGEEAKQRGADGEPSAPQLLKSMALLITEG